MKKLLLLLCSFCTFSAMAQTVIYTQNFNTGSASDWTLNTTDLGGDASMSDNQWVINNIYAGGSLAGATADQPAGIVGYPESYYMHIYSALGDLLGQPDNCNFDAGAPSSLFAAQSVAISTVGYTGVTFSFWWLCQGNATGSLGKVYYRTTSGGAWTQILAPLSTFHGSSTWNKDSVTLPAFDGQAFLEFGFQFNVGLAGMDPAFGVDDIMVTGSGGITPPPVFTTNPVASTICTGSNTSFTAVVTGATSYQWQRSTTGIAGPFTNITAGMDGGIYGASYTTTTLTITGATITDNGYAYQLVATGTGSTTSTPALLTVTTTPTAGTISGPSTICTGSSITLTDATTGGSWSSSDITIASVTSGGIVTGVTSGVAVITYTVTTSCGTASTTYNVTVTNTPSAGTITGSNTGCIGTPISLADATTGGVWSSSSTSVATISSTGVVTGVVAGTTVISYTVTSSCGTATATYNVTITNSASAGTITGPSNICAGSNITLTDAVTGGTWSSSNTTIATVSGGVVSGLTVGSDVISYTVSTVSCGNATATFTVNVIASGTVSPITSADSLCQGTKLMLTDAIGGGTWSSSNTNAVVTVDTVLGANAGTAIITYTLGSGCGYITQNFSIKPTPQPVVVAGGGHTLYVVGTYLNYQWLFGGSILVGATNSTYTYSINGNYQVRVDSGGCVGTSLAHTFGLSVSQLANTENTYGINQAGNLATLYATQPLTENINVNVFDLTGRLIFHDTWLSGSSTKLMNDTWLASGIYLIRLSNDNTNTVIKWLKQ